MMQYDSEVAVKVSRDEREIIRTFFASIGRYDVETQLEVLDSMSDKIRNICEKYEKKYVKEKSMYVQLGFLVGICVGVLVI